MSKIDLRNVSLAKKDDVEQAVQRIYAWYEGQTLDRPCIRFSAHNEQFGSDGTQLYTHEQYKHIWFDTERVVNAYIDSIQNRQFPAETFPVFWPNLGPDIYAALYGAELVFGEVTSWVRPCVKKLGDIESLRLDFDNEYARKIEELTACALEYCQGQYWVGYTDLHPGIDCVVGWRGVERLCMDLMDQPEQVHRMIEIASRDFVDIFDRYDSVLKTHDQPSVNWMEIPSFDTFHVPSCDFATMMSPQQFEEFALPVIGAEVKHATHNIFHLDGKGVAKNIDCLLEIPGINAIQWVQGAGQDEPIMQWLDLIRKIQDSGKGLVLDIKKHELEDLIDAISPKGLFLCIAESDPVQQQAIIKRIEKW